MNTNYTILRKMILAEPQNYTRSFLLTRVNTFFMFGQLNADQYSDLMLALDERYPAPAETPAK